MLMPRTPICRSIAADRAMLARMGERMSVIWGRSPRSASPSTGMGSGKHVMGDRLPMMRPRMCLIRTRFTWMGQPIHAMASRKHVFRSPHPPCRGHDCASFGRASRGWASPSTQWRPESTSFGHRIPMMRPRLCLIRTRFTRMGQPIHAMASRKHVFRSPHPHVAATTVPHSDALHVDGPAHPRNGVPKARLSVTASPPISGIVFQATAGAMPNTP